MAIELGVVSFKITLWGIGDRKAWAIGNQRDMFAVSGRRALPPLCPRQYTSKKCVRCTLLSLF